MSKWTKDAIEAPHTQRWMGGVKGESKLWDSLSDEQKEYALTAQPVAQEPVAWRFRHMHLPNEWKFAENPHRGKPWKDFEPLYAHPATPALVEAGLREAVRKVLALWANGCKDHSWRQHFDGAITALRAQSSPVSGEVKG